MRLCTRHRIRTRHCLFELYYTCTWRLRGFPIVNKQKSRGNSLGHNLYWSPLMVWDAQFVSPKICQWSLICLHRVRKASRKSMKSYGLKNLLVEDHILRISKISRVDDLTYPIWITKVWLFLHLKSVHSRLIKNSSLSYIYMNRYSR